MFGVNGASAESHRRFSERYGFTAPLLIDQGLRVAEQYDALVGMGPIKLMINRTVVGIGTDGRVKYYRRGQPSTDDILQAMSA